MKKRMSLFLLAAVFLTLSCGPAAGEPAHLFTDVQGHWAAGDIEQSSVFRLMSGYPENLFIPDRTLSKAEAMVVIGRSLGWDRQAGDISYGGIEFPDNLWEGYRKYVVLAADKQLIGKGEIPGFSFNDSATRLEMVLWMSRALNLAGNGAGLTFKDLGEVPVRFRDMLAGVVEAGIIKGLPGNLFNPSGTLTRGEMAVILSRLVDNGKVSPPSGSMARGKINLLDLAQNKISITTSTGTSTYELAGSFSAYRSGRKYDPSSFEAGEAVKILLDEAGKCALIAKDEGYSGPAAGEKGYVTGKYRDYFNVHIDYGKIVKVQAADVAFLINGDSTAYGSLKPGAPVELLKTGSAITAVRIVDGTPKVFGKVKDFGIGFIVIKDENGRAAFYDLDKRVKILDKNGLETDISGIDAGMNADLSLDENQNVKEIRLRESTGKDIEGRVEELDNTGSKKITVMERDGKRRAYYLAEGVTARDGGRALELDNIEKGMDVRISLDINNRATGIEVTDLSTVEGKVAQVTTSGQDRITIKERSGQDKTYPLSFGAIIKEGSGTIDLEDVEEGKDVRLTLGDGNWVTGIEVADLSTVVGDITGIRMRGTKWVALDSDRGLEEFYYANDNTGVTEGSFSYRFDFLEEGMRVRLTLDARGRVSAADIIGLPSLEGEITLIQTTGVRKITLKDKYSIQRTCYLADGVVATEGGRAISLSDVKDGMNIYLSLDSNGRVVKIDVPRLTAVEGEVISVKASGTAKINIRKSNGSNWAFYLDDGIAVKEAGIERSLLDVVKGMSVRLSLNDRGDITGIDVVGIVSAEGTVKQISARGLKRIEIDTSGKQGGVYDIYDDVLVRQGDIVRELDYIYEGMRVRMILDSDGYATRIDIL
ncbi:MAG: S-layer homology domain-containing protein [Desulfocucumaceae bacterium]